MKRFMIVIVAGLAFGVSAAYATTGHHVAGRTPAASAAAAVTFATHAGGATSTEPATADDNPATSDQAGDQGDEQSTPATAAGASSDDQESQDEGSLTSQDDNSQGDSTQGAGDQQGGQVDDQVGDGGGNAGDN